MLTLHVLSDAVVYSPSIPSGTTSLPTVNGEDVTIVNNGTITVDQATVIAPNVVLRNGVAHVIDRSDSLTLLFPRSGDVQTLTGIPSSVLIPASLSSEEPCTSKKHHKKRPQKQSGPQ